MDPLTKNFLLNMSRYSNFLAATAGIIANIISFKVFTREKFKKTSFSVYYQSLAISDSISLLWVYIAFCADRYRLNLLTTVFLCKYFRTQTHVGRGISSWLLTLISLDRVISLIFPKRFLFLTKKKIQLMVVGCITAYHVLFNIPLLIEMVYIETFVFDSFGNLTTKQISCLDPANDALIWIVRTNTRIIPFVIMLILTVLTVGLIVRSCRKLESKAVKSENLSINSDTKFAITSIVFNVLFIVLNLPVFILDFLKLDDDLSLVLRNVFNVFYHTSFAMNFFVNLLTNTIFRDEFLIMAKWKSAK